MLLSVGSVVKENAWLIGETKPKILDAVLEDSDSVASNWTKGIVLSLIFGRR